MGKEIIPFLGTNDTISWGRITGAVIDQTTSISYLPPTASRWLSFAAGKSASTMTATSPLGKSVLSQSSSMIIHTLLGALEGTSGGSPASLLRLSRLFHNNIFTSPSPASPPHRIITPQISPEQPTPLSPTPPSTGNSAFLINPSTGNSSNNWCVGSCHGWLAYVSRQDCSMFFTTPHHFPRPRDYYSPPVISLPSVETLPYVIGVVRDEVNGSTIIGFKTRNRISPFESLEIETPSFLARYLIKDMVVSSPPNSNNSIAMAIYGPARQIAFCQLAVRELGALSSSISSSWIDLDEISCDYLALAYSNKDRLFYAAKKAGCSTEVEAWDLSNPSKPKRVLSLPDYLVGSATHIMDMRNMNKVYLVECYGEMFYVLRYCGYVNEELDGTFTAVDANLEDGYPYKTLKFEVYKMVPGGFEYVDSLDDKVLFLGKNQSFVVSAYDFPGLTPDSIYFTDDEWAGTVYVESEDASIYEGRSVNYEYGGHDCGVYSLRDLTIIPLTKLNRIWPASIWVSNLPAGKVL